MYKHIIFFKFYTTNDLGVNVYKTLKCDKNQMPYYNVQIFKK
jgi:hypothetical protein